MSSTVKYYASVVDYTTGAVVWSLDWAETTPGVVPVLDSTGLPQDQIGVIFTNPEQGGASGTVTVTATVNGNPAQGGLTATVAAPGYNPRWLVPPTNADGLLDITNPTHETVMFPPIVDFSGTPLSGSTPLLVQFTDLSYNTPTSWLWDFGDGNTSTEQNPLHEYIDGGTYTVSLIATNSRGSNEEIKIEYINVASSFTWSSKYLVIGTKGVVIQRDVSSLRTNDIEITGMYTPESPALDSITNVIHSYNIVDDRVYFITTSAYNSDVFLYRYDPRAMVTEDRVSVSATISNPGRIIAMGDDICVLANDQLTFLPYLSIFNSTSLELTFTSSIAEWSNFPTILGAIGDGRVISNNATNDGILIIQPTSPTTYSATSLQLFTDATCGPQFSYDNNCYNATDRTVWVEYYTDAPDKPYAAIVNVDTLDVTYLYPPPGETFDYTFDTFWNSYTNTMIMSVSTLAGIRGCLEVSNTGTIIGIHGGYEWNQWSEFRPCGPYIVGASYNVIGQFVSGSPDKEPVGLFSNYDSWFTRANFHRDLMAEDTTVWCFVPPFVGTGPEPVPVYTTTPPAATYLGHIFDTWNSGDISLADTVTWFKITYDAAATLKIAINPGTGETVNILDMFIYDSIGRQVQVQYSSLDGNQHYQNVGFLAQNENLPGDYYIAVVLIDYGLATALTQGYDVYANDGERDPYTMQLSVTI